jgi:hypothetical protein
MYRPETEHFMRTIAAVVALGFVLAGCSDIYFDRRDTIALSGGDAVAANEAAQTIDPWPPGSNNPNIPANGQKMQIAVERYRTDRVIPPANPTTSDVENQQLTQMQAAAAAASSGPNTSSGNAPAPAASGTPAQ